MMTALGFSPVAGLAVRALWALSISGGVWKIEQLRKGGGRTSIDSGKPIIMMLFRWLRDSRSVNLDWSFAWFSDRTKHFFSGASKHSVLTLVLVSSEVILWLWSEIVDWIKSVLASSDETAALKSDESACLFCSSNLAIDAMLSFASAKASGFGSFLCCFDCLEAMI